MHRPGPPKRPGPGTSSCHVDSRDIGRESFRLSTQVSILVISYNTREDTLLCLRSVFEQTRETEFELIVLDNQSSDGSADAIEAEFGDRVQLIRSEENLGFARGNNEAARLATGEFLLLLNPDTVILDQAIDRLMAFARRTPEAGIWGGRTEYQDGSLNETSCWHRMNPWNLFMQVLGLTVLLRRSSLFNQEAMGGWDRSTERAVDIVTGCFLLIRREFWNELEGFGPEYFMYGEEADLCLRAAARGARPRVSPEATIIHHGGLSDTVRADKTVRLFKSKVLLIRQHFSPITRGLGRFLFLLYPLSRCWMHAILVMFGRGSSRDSLRYWREVWQRRDEWAT